MWVVLGVDVVGVHVMSCCCCVCVPARRDAPCCPPGLPTAACLPASPPARSGDTFLSYDQVVPYCMALLEVFRWGLGPWGHQECLCSSQALPAGHRAQGAEAGWAHISRAAPAPSRLARPLTAPAPRPAAPRLARRDHGARDDRQKARLMWLVEAMGVDAFRGAIEQRMGQSLRREVRQTHLRRRRGVAEAPLSQCRPSCILLPAPPASPAHRLCRWPSGDGALPLPAGACGV